MLRKRQQKGVAVLFENLGRHGGRPSQAKQYYSGVLWLNRLLSLAQIPK